MEAPAILPSDRRFGLTLCAVFLALGAYAVIRGHGGAVYLSLFATSLAFGSTALSFPRILTPLNLLWFRLGELLGRIVSPVVLGIIFFGLLAPIACTARLLGRDELRLKRRAVPSYWISRTPPGPTGQSFMNPF